MPAVRTKRQPESKIKSAVKQFLKLGGWFVFPIVQSALSYKGIADLCAIRDGRTVWIEIKTATGTQSDWQIAFQSDVEAHGAEYVVARSTEDVEHLVDCLRLVDRGARP